MTFSEKIYTLLKKVPKGKVTTYKDLANAAGSSAYRAVGQAMRCNQNAPVIPCHRVIASDGSIGGYFGETEGEPVQRKMAMLKREGIHFEGNKVKDFEKVRYKFR